MAKFHGSIGYMTTEETEPGIFVEVAEEVECQGDILTNYERWERGEGINDNLVVNNRFSIVADPHMYSIMSNIRYILWNGTKWAVSSIDIQRPRLILTIGKVYNG